MTETAAPTATSPPPASASELTFETRAETAAIVAAPVAVCALPEPRSAFVVVFTIAIETDGLTATPPAEPALSAVLTLWSDSAVIVTAAPPLNVAPFSTAARVVRASRMFSATEAPTPTVPPRASDDASAVSEALLFARRTTLQLPAATDAAAPTVPSVEAETMFSASAPAMPTLSLPAPDFATARTSCSASRK